MLGSWFSLVAHVLATFKHKGLCVHWDVDHEVI